MIDPAHRRQGLAREALGAVEVWLAGRGIAALRTAFQRRRLAVHPVVRALGFTEMSIREHALLGLRGRGDQPLGKAGAVMARIVTTFPLPDAALDLLRPLGPSPGRTGGATRWRTPEALLCLLTDRVDADLLDARAAAARSSPTPSSGTSTWTGTRAAPAGSPSPTRRTC